MSKRSFDEMSETQATGLPSMTASLLQSGRWSDLTIICKHKTWNVHRVICCLQSKPLAAAIDGPFQEAITGVIKLEDHDPVVVEHMINFFYTGKYEPKVQKASSMLSFGISSPTADEIMASLLGPAETFSPKTPSEPESPALEPALPASEPVPAVPIPNPSLTPAKALLIHTSVYLLADEKDISTLKELAMQRYKEAARDGWNSSEFCTSLKTIFDETPESDRSFWNMARELAGEKAKKLMDRGEFVTLCKERGDIGTEIFKEYLAKTPEPPKVVYMNPNGCPNYGMAHAPYVVRAKARRKNWYCSECSMQFD